MKPYLMVLFFFTSLLYGADIVVPLPASEMEAKAKKEKWDFKYKAYSQSFHTGLVKPLSSLSKETSSKFSSGMAAVPKVFLLSSFAPLAPVSNQGNCGSCVYFATISTFSDTMRAQGMVVPAMAHQELMDCYARDWRCSGSYFEKVATGLVKAGQLHAESDYPYRAANGTCKSNVLGEKYGKIESFTLIDPTPASIAGALQTRHAVAVTIGAGGAWMNYSSGVFSACSSVGTNHQVEVVGIDCEASVDAAGNCAFDSKGKLPNGVGAYLIKNSWGINWGDQGYVWMKITDKSGRECNNVAEEAGILETGINPEPPKPPCTPDAKANAGTTKSILLNEVN